MDFNWFGSPLGRGVSIVRPTEKRKRKVSAEIWLNIEKAVKEVRPDLVQEFQSCRDKTSICKFLEKNFPLTSEMVEQPSWSVQLMTKTPDILRSMKK